MEVSMEGYYSVKEAAERLGCSTKTIRTRIKNQTLEAVWEDRGRGMSQWWIPAAAINSATSTIEVVPVVKPLTTTEVRALFKEAVQEELEPLRGEIQNLRAELESHYRRTDERLREATKSRSFWTRLFNKK